MKKIVVCCVVQLGVAMASFGAAKPTAVELLDKCTMMWRDKRYEELYSLLEDVRKEKSGYVPCLLASAIGDGNFGRQYEVEVDALRSLTNGLQEVFCEMHPELPSRLAAMIDDEADTLRICNSMGHDREYRKVRNDPRHKTDYSFSRHWMSPAFESDLPYLVPNVSLRTNWVDRTIPVRRSRNADVEKLSASGVLRQVVDDELTYSEKKRLMDDWISYLVATGGIKEVLVDKDGALSRGELVEDWFKTDLLELDGYHVLDILCKDPIIAKPLLKEYIGRDVSFEGTSKADRRRRIAAWALLQLAHDDSELVAPMRELADKVGKQFPQTKAYLEKAVHHLEKGCDRHFRRR